MAQKRYCLKHLKSDVLIGGRPKLPTPDQLPYGEIAINYAKGHETLAIKNSQDEIITLNFDSSKNGKIDDVKVNGTSVVQDRVADITINSKTVPHTNAEGDTTNVGDELIAIKADIEAVTVSSPKKTINVNGREIDVNVDGSTVKYNTTTGKIYADVDAITSEVEEKVNNEIERAKSAERALAEAAGTLKADETIGYVVEGGSNYIKTATSVHNATVLLDAQIKNVSDKCDSLIWE